MSDTVNILCMKWGDKFSPDYVNKLYGMVSRNLTLPFRFVCLTDDPQGLNPKVECFPLPDLSLPEGLPERGWNKLSSFSKDLYGIQGKVLFLDLDVLIVGSLDDFFGLSEGFYIIRDFIRKDGTGNSSVYLFDAGKYDDILTYFRENANSIRKKHRNEQEFLSHYLIANRSLNYWPSKWCQSFKYHCLPGGVIGSWFKPSVLPVDARIIVFHGKPSPRAAVIGESGKWYRKVRPTLWINDYWKE
jgi:hypothetical protein